MGQCLQKLSKMSESPPNLIAKGGLHLKGNGLFSNLECVMCMVQSVTFVLILIRMNIRIYSNKIKRYKYDTNEYSYSGLRNLLQPCSRAARKWRENEKIERRCRENEEMDRE